MVIVSTLLHSSIKWSFFCKRISVAEYIRGYDIEGNEKLWIVTSGKVNSLAFVDFNNDSKNEVSANETINPVLQRFSLNKIRFFFALVSMTDCLWL